MERRELLGKIILRLVGALLALAYLGLCLYVGITGKSPSIHRVEHVMRFGELKNRVSGGTSVVMIFALCITSTLNDLNFQKGRKKSFLPLLLTTILPITFLLLLESYLDIGWIGIALYVDIVVFLLGVAQTPQLLNQWTARRLLRNELMSGKQQVQTIEWIYFYPPKKLLIPGLWGFGVVLVLRGIWVAVTGKIEMDGELFLFLLGAAVLAVALFQKTRRYICTPYRSIPVLNQILSKKQLERLLDGEHFEPIEFEDEDMKKYLEIRRSQNFVLIGGKLLLKKFALWVIMNRSGNDASLRVLYLNGMTAKVKVDSDTRGDRYKEFIAVLKELIRYESTLELDEKGEQLAQKFTSFSPEQTSEQDRVAAFLSQDVVLIW